VNTEPDPDLVAGTDLETRGETLPDVSVAHRAGSIVSEFVSSVLDEARARAPQIVAEAQEEADGMRRAAAESSERIHERVDILSRELSALVGELREEAASLSGRAGLGEEAGVGLADGVGGADGAAGFPAPLQAEHDYAGDVAGAPDETRARLSRMEDEELAHVYRRAVRASQRDDRDEEYAEGIRSLAHAAVEEALRRPAFGNDYETPPRGLLRGRRRRRPDEEVLGELRAACSRAREYGLAAPPR
jgi:hypothetical protein